MAKKPAPKKPPFPPKPTTPFSSGSKSSSGMPDKKLPAFLLKKKK